MRIPSWMMRVERKLAARLFRLLAKSIKFEIINKPDDSFLCIFMFWHRDMIPMTLHRIGSNACVLVSPSQDGELIAGPIEELGFITARGSTTRQGSQAYRTVLRMARERQLGITPDGPKGPSKVIQPGVIHISYMAKVPIVPVALHASREWVFNSWDRFRLPKPFCKLTAIYGEPHFVNSKADMESAPTQLKAMMQGLEAKLPT